MPRYVPANINDSNDITKSQDRISLLAIYDAAFETGCSPSITRESVSVSVLYIN